MNTSNSPDEDDDKNKEGHAPAEAAPTDQGPPAPNLEPIREAQKRASTVGYLFGQILRGASSGIAKGFLDDFLNGD